MSSSKNRFFGNVRTLFTKPIRDAVTYIRKYAHFRYGQTYSHSEASSAVYRVPLLTLIAIILPEKAMKEGFDFVNKDDEINKEVTKQWDEDNFLPDIIRGVQFDATHGAVTFAFFEGRENKESLELLCFDPDDVGLFVNENGFITRYELTEKIGSVNRPEIIHHIPKVKLDKDDKKIIDNEWTNDDNEMVPPNEQIKNVFHVVIRKSKVRFRGVPTIEKFWDIAHSENIILESMTVGTVRAGYGLKKATIHDRKDKPEMNTVEAKISSGLTSLDSGDNSIIVYSGTDDAGNKWEDKVEIDSGNMDFDYTEKIDIIHKVCSFLSGLPKNYLDGIFAGETLAGDIIYRMIQTVLRELRDEWTEYLIPIVERWSELKGTKLTDGWKIEWRMPKAKLTEKEEAEIDSIISDTQATLVNAGIIDVPEARTTLEIKEPDKIIEKPPDLKMSVDGMNETNPPTTGENSEEVGATTP